MPQSGGCPVTFTNPGPPALTACVSGHGNINQLGYGPFAEPASHMQHRGLLPARAEHEHGVLGRGHAGRSGMGGGDAELHRHHDHGDPHHDRRHLHPDPEHLLQVRVAPGADRQPAEEQRHRLASRALQPVCRHRHGCILGVDVFDTAGASVVAQETNGVALTSLGNPGLVQALRRRDLQQLERHRQVRVRPHLRRRAHRPWRLRGGHAAPDVDRCRVRR